MKDEKINGINIVDGEVKKKKSYKGLIIAIVVIIALAIVGVVGYTVYSNYEEEQERILQEAIKTVAEVDETNLQAEYNKEYTNNEIQITLTTNSNDNIVYSLNKENYINYNGSITINENTIIYVKYVNNYGTYSQEPYIVEITNIDKELPIITKKDVETATSSLSTNIEATDNVEVSKIEVSIDGENYNEVTNNKYTFEGLKEGTEYTVNIRVTDRAGNVTEDTAKGTTTVTKKTTSTKSSSSSSSNSSTSSKSSTPSKANSSSSSKSSSSNSKTTTMNVKSSGKKTKIYLNGEDTGSYYEWGEETEMPSDWAQQLYGN